MISPASPAGTIALYRHGCGLRLGLRVVLAETRGPARGMVLGKEGPEEVIRPLVAVPLTRQTQKTSAGIPTKALTFSQDIYADSSQ
jgi:hypothetical protein